MPTVRFWFHEQFFTRMLARLLLWKPLHAYRQ
ncbi:hypothetical protein Goarm_016539 [Gossypium armourianum]|uniref:Uncharacterized protein n=1 Tax=Gossypium armourianum TaxID=34283 RepID=A0A7J9JCL9_9ROSI|nr:hypothetical protein [Gossypium armourianum]